MYLPFNYEQINVMAASYNPSCVKAYNNEVFDFWERALFQRALSIMDISLPDDWSTGGIDDLFYYCLFSIGYLAIFNTPEFGTTFQPCNLSGIDFYYRPTRALITNPAVPRGLDLKIGEECAILKLTPDYMGIRDITGYYAEKLACLDNAINMSLINNKYAFMLGAKNRAAGEALKKMLDLVNSGQPAVIFDRKIADSAGQGDASPFQVWDQGNLKEKYLTSDQLQDFRTILHNFDTEVGIPSLPAEKKERMITDEAQALTADATSRSKIWLKSINSSAREVNEMFGIQISARLTYEEGGVSNEDDPMGIL